MKNFVKTSIVLIYASLLLMMSVKGNDLNGMDMNSSDMTHNMNNQPDNKIASTSQDEHKECPNRNMMMNNMMMNPNSDMCGMPMMSMGCVPCCLMMSPQMMCQQPMHPHGFMNMPMRFPNPMSNNSQTCSHRNFNNGMMPNGNQNRMPFQQHHSGHGPHSMGHQFGMCSHPNDMMSPNDMMMMPCNPHCGMPGPNFNGMHHHCFHNGMGPCQRPSGTCPQSSGASSNPQVSTCPNQAPQPHNSQNNMNPASTYCQNSAPGSFDQMSPNNQGESGNNSR